MTWNSSVLSVLFALFLAIGTEAGYAQEPVEESATPLATFPMAEQSMTEHPIAEPPAMGETATEVHPVRDTGIGCATGAVLGSVLPGLGNAVGCVIGGFLGWWLS